MTRRRRETERRTEEQGPGPVVTDRSIRLPLGALGAGDRPLDADAVRYLCRVRRLRPGERFIVFDPESGAEADAELSSPATAGSRASALVRVGELRPGPVLPLRAITVLQALGKGTKLDAIVRDATELGASRIAPVLAERSVRRSAAERHPESRWQRIAVEAARQSGRSTAPTVDPVSPLEAALDRLAPVVAGGLGLCLDPSAGQPAREVMARLGPGQPVVLLIGPEGGLTGAEMDAAGERGFARVTLGPFVLRTETVCAALLGALLVLGR